MCRAARWQRDPLRPRGDRHRLGQHRRDARLQGLGPDRHHRGEPLRRHLPQRGLHPDQDVRLPRRPRTPGRARTRAGGRHATSTAPAGRRSATASSAGSTRSCRAARTTAAGCPTSTCTTSTARSSTTTPSTRARKGQITADQIVIAAGSRVSVADIPGLDEVDFHTSDTVMRLAELPRRMTIVGGGYVAAEFAHVFSALGTEVTQVHRGPALLSHLDEDVSRTLHRAGRPTVGGAPGHRGPEGPPPRRRRRWCLSPTGPSSRPTYS